MVYPHQRKKGKLTIAKALKPAIGKRKTDISSGTIAGRAQNYAVAFQFAGKGFWDRVSALRNMQRDKLGKGKTGLIENTFQALKWRTHFPDPLPDAFVDAFVQAVRAKKFPKKQMAQARFLGESLGADGTVSPRRSRDICGQQRRTIQQTTEKSPARNSPPPSWWEPQADAKWRQEVWEVFSPEYKAGLAARGVKRAEFYIHCCGKRGFTVNHVCSECGRNPFSTP